MGDGWRTSGVRQRRFRANNMVPMGAHERALLCEKKLFLRGKEHHVMEF